MTLSLEESKTTETVSVLWSLVIFSFSWSVAESLKQLPPSPTRDLDGSSQEKWLEETRSRRNLWFFLSSSNSFSLTLLQSLTRQQLFQTESTLNLLREAHAGCNLNICPVVQTHSFARSTVQAWSSSYPGTAFLSQGALNAVDVVADIFQFLARSLVAGKRINFQQRLLESLWTFDTCDSQDLFLFQRKPFLAAFNMVSERLAQRHTHKTRGGERADNSSNPLDMRMSLDFDSLAMDEAPWRRRLPHARRGNLF